jgi:RNA polymerase sigma factor (sigma-70 family)
MISWEEAEDLFQSALARVLEKEPIKDGNKDPEEIRKIIYGYLKFIIQEWWRDEVIKKRASKREEPPSESDFPPVSNDTAESIYSDAWDAMTDKERIVFELYYLNNNTQSMVKDEMGCSIGTINSMLKQIHDKFYTIYEKYSEVYYGTRQFR